MLATRLTSFGTTMGKEDEISHRTRSGTIKPPSFSPSTLSTVTLMITMLAATNEITSPGIPLSRGSPPLGPRSLGAPDAPNPS